MMRGLIPLIVFVGLVVAFAASMASGQNVNLIVELPGGDGVVFSGNLAFAATDAGRAEYAPLAGYNAVTFNLYVDTPDDILLVDFQIDLSQGDIWQDTIAENAYGQLGSDLKAPNPAAFANWPALAADSWVQTPGATARADDTSFLGPATVTHFDTDASGAQQDFNFARITLIGYFDATFKGSVQVANTAGPITQAFSFRLHALPEPGTMGLVLSAFNERKIGASTDTGGGVFGVKGVSVAGDY